MTRATKYLATHLPGIWRNAQTGTWHDDRGRRLTFAQLKEADAEYFTEAGGSAPDSPAALLRAIALDPRERLDVRIKAAKDAAPYYDSRMPLRIEGQVQTTGIDPAKLAAMPVKERKVLLDLLKKAGVSL